MAQTFARLRSDLEMRPETSDPRSPVVVKDPVARRFYRFTWVQAAVLRRMDGRRAPGEIAAAAAGECQVPVETSQVEDFTARLQGLLLLDNELSWSRLKAGAGRRASLLTSLLRIKVRVVNPDRLLTRLEKRLGRFFFGPGFTALAWISVTAGVIISILNWNQLVFSLPRIFTLFSVPLILAVAFTVMTIHELGHGLTLKHFGGSVEEMGLMFLYFIPAFYCNVSDAWLLRKRERIFVSLAGGYVQLVVWAWATILWRLLSPETLASRVCLIAIAFASIQTILNFNPLIPLDGYYLLGDWLETPNLRGKAFDYLKRRSRNLFTGRGGRNPFFTVREKRMLIAYGMFSFVFTAGLLILVLVRVGSWLLAEYRTWGMVLFAMLCFAVAPWPGKTPPEAGQRAENAQARPKRRGFPAKLVILVLLLLAGFLPWELKVVGDFTIRPGATVVTSPQVGGTLSAIFVDEGSRVKQGDVLAELQNLEVSHAYEETRGELASRKAELDLLMAGNRPEEIERARKVVETKKADLANAGRVEEQREMLRSTVAKREAELAHARTTFESSSALLAQGLIPRNDLDRDRTAFEVAQKAHAEALGALKVLDEMTLGAKELKAKELAQAQSELNIQLAGSRKESIRAVEAEVAKLEEQLKILQEQIDLLKIRSPIQGQVATPYLKNRLGAFLEQGKPFCQIVDTSLVIVDMPVAEKEIADVALGNPIILKLRPFPMRTFEANVKAISPVADEASEERKVVIRGELPNPDGSLKTGMTGVGKILCGKRLIINLVSRRLIRWLRTEFWEYLP